MNEALQPLLDWIAEHPHGALWLLFLLAALDAIFIIGAFVPAALPLFAIGALVALGALDLWQTLLIAAAGALAGDAFSFWLGSRYGERLFQGHLFRKHPEIVERARSFFQRRGAYSVFLARFLGPLRAVTPALAAAAGMPLWKFLLVDSVSAYLWACAFILPGVVFGASLGLAAEVAGRLATLLIGLLALLWGALWLTATVSRYASAKAGVWIPRLIEWSRWRRATGRRGFSLVDADLPESPALAVLALLLLIVATALLWLIGGARLHQYPLPLDAAIFQWLRDLHTPWGVQLTQRLVQIGAWPVYVPIAATCFVMLAALRKRRAAAHWMGALAFGGAITLGLYATPLLPPPLLYFDSMATLAARGRDLILATITYGFLPVLLATRRRQPLRRILYSCSAVLLTLLFFAQLYLGVQWFSIGALLVLLGLIWVAVLGLAYRLHRPDLVLTRHLLLPIAICFTAALTLRWGTLTAPLPATPPYVEILAAEDWLAGRELGRFPAHRQDVAGRPRQSFTLQWAGELREIERRLTAAGWQPTAPLNAGQMLHWLTSTAEIGDLPVMPQVHHGEHPALTLRLPIDETHQFFLRLWFSHYRLDDGRPVWFGNIARQEARVFRKLLRYPVATSFEPPLAQLLNEIADTHYHHAAPVYLLW